MATYKFKRKLYAGVASGLKGVAGVAKKALRDAGAVVGKQANKTSVGRFLWDNKGAIGTTAAMGTFTTGIGYGINKGFNSRIKKDNKALMDEYKKDLDSYEERVKQVASSTEPKPKTYSIGRIASTILDSRKKGITGLGRVAKETFINQTNKMKSYGGVMKSVGEFSRKNPKLALGTLTVAAGTGLRQVGKTAGKATSKALQAVDKSAFKQEESVNPYVNLPEELDKINKKYNV